MWQNIESETKKCLFAKKKLLEKLMLKESIADVVIEEHYEQRFLEIAYIFQQDHFGSKINASQNIEL